MILKQLSSVLLASLALLAEAAANPPPTQLGVFRGPAPSGPGNTDAYAVWLGQPDMWAEAFLGQDTWDNIQWPAWLTGPWSTWAHAQPGRRVLIGVPMLPKEPATVTLAAGATGAYNSYFQRFAQDLVSKGLAEEAIIRLGWEFNGGWFKWKASGDPESFKTFWQQIVTTMRAVPGAEDLEFCWNPVYGNQQFPAEQAYPGDAYVDHIALDLYDESWIANTYPWPTGTSQADIEARRATVWNSFLNGSRCLNFWQTFAAQHNKPFGIAEWGVNNRPDGHGGMDNASFVLNMYNYMATHDVAWAVYFDVQAGDGHHQLSPITGGTDFPLARAAFLWLFGGTPPSNANIVREPVADAYVRDSTYAATNFGSDPVLVVKNDANYNRETFLRFDVAGLAQAASVKIKIVPESVGDDTARTTFSFEFVPSDTWTESGITWNTKPASTTVLGTSTGFAVERGTVLDVTNLARQEAAGDGFLSIRIRSTTAGAARIVTLGSSENAGPGLRPRLEAVVPQYTLEPEADAFVRDGTYAATNYGSDTGLTVKLDGSSYARQTFLRFRVRGLADAENIKLVLTPVSVGTDGASTALSYDFVSDDSWTESGITWNNRPTAGTTLATATGYSAGQPIELDLTQQIKSEAVGDGFFTLRIRSTVSGSQRTITFGSAEHGTPANRPFLEIYP